MGRHQTEIYIRVGIGRIVRYYTTEIVNRQAKRGQESLQTCVLIPIA